MPLTSFFCHCLSVEQMAGDKTTGPKKRKLRDLPFKKKVKLLKTRHLAYKDKMIQRKSERHDL